MHNLDSLNDEKQKSGQTKWPEAPESATISFCVWLTLFLEVSPSTKPANSCHMTRHLLASLPPILFPLIMASLCPGFLNLQVAEV